MRSAKAESKEGGLRILVVEDNPVNSLMAVRVLEKHGHSVWAVASGEEALALLQPPTLRCNSDGYSNARYRWIRNNEAHPQDRNDPKDVCPVIATTAHALDADRERCLAAGMDEYLTKPLQFPELLAALARVTRQSTTRPEKDGDIARACEAKY